MEILDEADVIVDGDVVIAERRSEKGEYIFDLKESQVVRLIYFFGARKLNQRAMRKNLRAGGMASNTFTAMERKFLTECFVWFDMVTRDSNELASAYRALTLKFKAVIGYLRKRPGMITPEIHVALKSAGYNSVLKNVVMVMNENRELVPKMITDDTVNGRSMAPLGQIEARLWEFQNVLTDKMAMIIESITAADMRKANLGMKSKALRDLYSVMFMAKKDTKNPNQVLVNVNIQGSDAKTKLQVVSQYAAKNREGKG